jgi:hypothetical protein
LLALDTQDRCSVLWNCFLNGSATVVGPTNNLFIKVVAESEKGTEIRFRLIMQRCKRELFVLSPKEKYNIKMESMKILVGIKGLELEFDLDITPDAEVEVIWTEIQVTE